MLTCNYLKLFENDCSGAWDKLEKVEHIGESESIGQGKPALCSRVIIIQHGAKLLGGGFRQQANVSYKSKKYN